MIAIEFDAQVSNGHIEIPDAHRASVQGEVHVIVISRSTAPRRTIIQDLLQHPLHIPGFQPLTREKAHQRA